MSDPSIPGARPSAGLSRVLGFWQVTASGVGVVVGAGIYVLIGEATAEAGSGVWMAFLLAGALSALTALSYAELASMFPRASAEYEFSRQALPQPIAFVVGWVMIAGLTIGAAAVALGFARYFREFIALDDRIVALGLLGLIAALALSGIKNSARVTLAFSIVQIGGLLIVSIVGFGHVGDVDIMETNGFAGVFGAAALVFFAFIGFDEVITLSEETNDPTRTTPRALLATLAVSTALYSLVAVVAVSVVGATVLGTSEAPLADVVGEAFGGGGSEFIAVVAMISTFNTTLLILTAGSRMTYGMASSGALPAILARVNRRHAPAYAITLAIGIAAAFVLVRDLSLIAGVTDSAVYLVFLAVNATLIILRVTKPEIPRPFRVPWTVGKIPVIPVLGFLATLGMLTQLSGRSLLIAAAIVAAGTVAFTVVGRARSEPATA